MTTEKERLLAIITGPQAAEVLKAMEQAGCLHWNDKSRVGVAVLEITTCETD